MAEQKNQVFYVKSIPKGEPTLDTFELKDAAYPNLQENGEVLVKSLYLSVDPYLRFRLPQGQIMQSFGVVEVVESKNDDFKVGDKFVTGEIPWARFSVMKVEKNKVWSIPSDSPLPDSAFIGVAGMPGATAYFGLLVDGQLKDSDKYVLVSGAAGAVGSLVGQIAKIKGKRVVGIAGGAEKCRHLVEDLGFDAAIDYKNYKDAESIAKAITDALPEGIDVYFDNVGGYITDSVWDLIRPNARVVVCGQIANYNDTEVEKAPRFLFKLIYKTATVKGTLVGQFFHRRGEFLADLFQWVKDGKVTYRETELLGFEKMPEAFLGLFHGKNTGKMIVKI